MILAVEAGEGIGTTGPTISNTSVFIGASLFAGKEGRLESGASLCICTDDVLHLLSGEYDAISLAFNPCHLNRAPHLAVLAGGLGDLTFQGLASSAPWLVDVAGIILIGAGLYQFTPLKSTCLRACRNPLSFIMQHDFGRGAPGAFRAGASHGLFCLGCCWALMSVLVVVGFMNLAWMGALALLFFAEKNWRRGVLLSRVAGTAIAVLGIAVLAYPALLQSVS